MAVDPIRGAVAAGRAANEAAGIADTLIRSSRLGGTGVVDTAALAEKVAAVGATDPQKAMALSREINGKLPIQDQRRFQESLRSELAERNLPATADGGAAAAKARRELALDVTQMALDVAGLFDPTPASDGANAVISLFRGDFLGAGLSAVSVIPYLGDAAKLGKLGKWAQTVERAVDLAKVDGAFAKTVEPALKRLKGALDDITPDMLKALPQSVQDTVARMRGKLDELAGATPLSARVGGNQVTWQVDNAGRPTRVEATLTEVQPKGTPRSQAELDAQDRVRARGVADDDAGHIIGHRFMPDQGTVNMFPQQFNFNRSAYKKLENEWADWIGSGATVKVRVDLTGASATRPDKVSVFYEVIDPKTKEVIYDNRVSFMNGANQTFDRVPKGDMRGMLQ